MGTEFIWPSLNESLKVWMAHAEARTVLIKARSEPRGTMTWDLWELQALTRHPAQRGGGAWAPLQVHRAYG